MVCTVLIVDDEKPVRDFLSKDILWEELGCSKPICAANGKQAIELYEKNQYDLVIADIQMPIMDGLTMIEHLKQINPDVKIIILSCHEKFNYAKKAVKLGVQDYIIKDLTDTKELSELIKSLVEKIKTHKSEGNTEKDKIIALLKKVMLGEEKVPRGQLKQLSEYGMTKYNMYTVICFEIDYYTQTIGNTLSIHIMSELVTKLNQFFEKGIVFQSKENEGILIIYSDTNSELRYIADSIETSNSIREVGQKLGVESLSIGISDCEKNFYNLRNLYLKAQEALSWKLFIGTNKNIIYKLHHQKNTKQSVQQLEKFLADFKKTLDQTGDEYEKILEMIYQEQLMSHFRERYYVKFVNASIWSILLEFSKKSNRNKEKFFEDKRFPIEEINQKETLEEICNAFKQVIHQIKTNSKVVLNIHNPLVQQAIDLIETKYQQDIGLSDIANSLHIHKGYLCRIFKEETGENLMEYLLNFRIERAKHLLQDTTLKLYEISEAVGFATPQYFSIVFKKEVGISPQEFRKQAIS